MTVFRRPTSRETLLVGLGVASGLLGVAHGQCGKLVWSQDFETPTIEEALADAGGIAFPDVPDSPGVITEARGFDATYGGLPGVLAQIAYTKAISDVQLAPDNFDTGQWGSKQSSNDKQTCAAWNMNSNRNSLIREAPTPDDFSGRRRSLLQTPMDDGEEAGGDVVEEADDAPDGGEDGTDDVEEETDDVTEEPGDADEEPEDEAAGEYDEEEVEEETGEEEVPAEAPVEEGIPSGNQVLQMDFPKGCLGKECAMAVRVTIGTLSDTPLEEATATYRFKFQEGFKFGRGGKLPGLCGGLCNTGCVPVDGTTGFSARHQWVECLPKPEEQVVPPTPADRRCDHKLIVYPYHGNKVTRCGDEFTLANSGGAIEPQPGKWYTLTSYIKMNTAGPPGGGPNFKEDGIMKTWLDGKLVLEETNMFWRQYNNVTIDQFYVQSFFGGSDERWVSPQDQYIRFDDFKVNEGFCPPTGALEVLPKKIIPTRGGFKRSGKRFNALRNKTVGLGTNVLKTLRRLSRRRCWDKCVETEGCQSALHVLSTRPRTCQLLDSVAEHRLVDTPRRARATLLYSANRRQMAAPPIGWNDTRTDFPVPCPVNFGAPDGEYGAPVKPTDGRVLRKEQCGGNRAWVRRNPPGPATTCKGFLHCQYRSPNLATCERTRENYIGVLDPCSRVGEGDKCGGDKKFARMADRQGGICCETGLDCVWKSPTESICENIPDIMLSDTPFGGNGTRPKTATSGKKCGGSIEGTALSADCEDGLLCEYQKPFFAKCVKPTTTPKKFVCDESNLGQEGEQCMGSREWVLGLPGLGGSLDGGVCCAEGLRCIFQEAFLGTCEKDPDSTPPPPDGNGGRPKTAKNGEKCGGSVQGTEQSADCEEGLICEYQKPLFAKCVTPESTPKKFVCDETMLGQQGVQCMGSKEWVAALPGLGGDPDGGVCCEDGLRCVFQEPFLGTCETGEVSTPTPTDPPPVGNGGRPKTAKSGEKCGGSVQGTEQSADCEEGLICEYQKPLFAKCVTPESTPKKFVCDETMLGQQGVQCMGSKEWVAALPGLGGDPDGGVCCAEGLRCVFQEPFLGTCE